MAHNLFDSLKALPLPAGRKPITVIGTGSTRPG